MDHAALKSHLIDSKRLTVDEIARAEDYALTTGMALEEAIIFLKLMNNQAMGQCLSEVFKRPYRSLLEKAPSDITRTKVPLKVAEALQVFPVAYDVKSDTLTLAVHDPSDAGLLQSLRQSISPSMHYEITVASKSEIRTAIDVYYKGRPYVPAPELSLPHGFAIVTPDKKKKESLDLDEELKSGSRILLIEPDMERSRAMMTLLRREGFPHVRWVASMKEAVKAIEDEPVDRLVINGRAFKPQGGWLKQLPGNLTSTLATFYNIRNMLMGQEYPYSQMSESLLSLVSFVIRKGLQNDKDQLDQIIATARYCKLLAMRIGLPVIQVDGAVLAAWLSAPGIGKVLYEQMASPYPIDEIYDGQETMPSSARIEVRILRLVQKYQALKKNYPEMANDIGKVRKKLETPQDTAEERSLLESFLNVIKDEEFLKDAGRANRRILVVDPEYRQDSALAFRLSNDGYEVLGVSDARAAAKVILDAGVDLVISEVNLPETEGMRFCRAIRENDASAHLPFFFLTGEQSDRLATQCLEAGADDFFLKPPDLEMMSIKIRNILALKSSRGARSGISGTLADMSFTDIIQSLTTGEKDVEIQLQSRGKKGVIYIQQGDIIYAQAQGLEGQDAFYKMMTWQEGEFEIKACTTIPPRNIFESAMSLLMEGARIADEASMQNPSSPVSAKQS